MSPEDDLCLNISTEPLQNQDWTKTKSWTGTRKRPGSAQDKWARKKLRWLQQETTSDPHRKQEVHPEVRGQPAQAPPPERNHSKPQKKKVLGVKEPGDKEPETKEPATKEPATKERGAKEGRQKKTRFKDRRDEDAGDKDVGDKDVGDERSRGSFKTSSLFKHNPEIPEIKSSSVCPLKETVFSSSSFEDLDLHPHLVATLSKVLNVSTMTSVQQKSIPVLLSGRDAVVRSQTGSGKTLSYAVPVVQSLQGLDPKVQRSDGPVVLVLVPTRELALQTLEIFQKLLKPFTWIVPGVLIGGEKRKAEKARLRRGINVLVATPGRLVDHVQHTLSLSFRALRWLILDEADRTLDLGFEKELTVVLNSLSSSGSTPQNVLLSATISPGVTRLVDVCLKDPITMQVSDPAPSEAAVQSESSSSAVIQSESSSALVQSESFSVPEGLKQFVVIVPSKVRLVCLSAFIIDKRQEKLVVFVSGCEVVEFLHLVLSSALKKSSANQELRFLRLHGNMKQEERLEVFREFSEAASGVLICTDVASRGLHLPRVSWVVHYTPPPSVSQYVHRAGRTARGGLGGHSLLVLCPHESDFVRDLNQRRLELHPLLLTDLLSVLLTDPAYRGRGRYHSQVSKAALEQEIKERATVLQTQFEDLVHSNPETLALAKTALQSYLRAYTTYPAPLRHLFHLRHLHLGHTAKSFGLRDAPSGLWRDSRGKSKQRGGGDRSKHDRAGGESGGGEADRRPEKGQKRRKPLEEKSSGGGSHRVSDLLRSEFSSGLQPKTKKNRTQGLEETGES